MHSLISSGRRVSTCTSTYSYKLFLEIHWSAQALDRLFAPTVKTPCSHVPPCLLGSPFEGAYRPVDRLLMGRFLRAPAEGEWVLRILDKVSDSSNGAVRSWSLDLEMRPCYWQRTLRSAGEGRALAPNILV